MVHSGKHLNNLCKLIGPVVLFDILFCRNSSWYFFIAWLTIRRIACCSWWVRYLQCILKTGIKIDDFLWNPPQKKQFLKIKTLFSLLKSLGTTSKISFLQLYKLIRINHTNIESIIFLRYWLRYVYVAVCTRYWS